MRKCVHVVILSAFLFAIAGCATDVAIRDELNRNTQSVSDLLSGQETMIREKASPQDVHAEIAKADAIFAKTLELCKQPFSRECEFFVGLNDYFVARMTFNSAKYYASKDDKAKAEQVLNDFKSRFTNYTTQSEAARAKQLLEHLAAWDTYTPGWKAYLLGDYVIALKEFTTSDDARSLYEVGRMYELGNGVPNDGKKAVEWYLKSADGGFAPAQYRVGMFYLKGEWVEQSRKEAKKWLEKAEDQKYQPAIEAMNKIRNIELMESVGSGNIP